MINASDILKANLLIVDDQTANVLLLERLLSSAGYTSITSTQNPREVCELHRKNNYDLILLDLQMPNFNGFQVMEDLKEIEAEGYLPVLVITAQPDEKLRALKAGAKDFISKPFDLAEVLVRVQNLLEVRLLHSETKKLYEQVVAEQKVSERLLHNVLPKAIAERLKGRPEVMADTFSDIIADTYPDVTVLFADIVGFTKFSEGVSADVLITVLNDIFVRFDTIADHWGLEKIKTIGDSYMAAAGLPNPMPNHAERAANMALDMLEVMNHFNEQSAYQLNIRIGMSTGAAVAGVIGRRKFLYDLWGDVVNTASRMESHGVAGRIQITDSTRQQLGELFQLEKRGTIEVKGKGEMNTWFINSHSGSIQAQPTSIIAN
ncbi:MAG: adenylate/guanylate cyclase domain-containing protein [bacterium]